MFIYGNVCALFDGCVIWKITMLSLFSANPTKWSNTLKQFVGNMYLEHVVSNASLEFGIPFAVYVAALKPMNYLSVFGHFVGLALKGLGVILNV